MRRRRLVESMTDISILSSKVTTLSRCGKTWRQERLGLRPRCSWQTAVDGLIDGPRPEDGTDFASYAPALLAISLSAIAACGGGWPRRLPGARAIDPAAKLMCVSYAPFRGAQTPLSPTTHVAPEQIAQDLEGLARITDCVRTYSIENASTRFRRWRPRWD